MRYRLLYLLSGLFLAWSAMAATSTPDFRALAQDIQKGSFQKTDNKAR